MEDPEPDGWPQGDEDWDILTKERIGYVSERVGGVWTLTLLVLIDSTQQGGGKVTSAWTPFQEESEEAVVQAAKQRYPDLNVVSQHEWDKVFFKTFSRDDGGRPSSFLGGTGKRVAAERGSRGGFGRISASGTPGLSAAGLPKDWGRGTRTRSVSSGRQGAEGARPSVAAESLKDFPLDEWVPIVQCAKRLGYPPQYLYNAVYHGKIKTQGERPKKALWRDVLSKYRPDVLKEVMPRHP